jgi:hypothetical protein
MEQERGWFNGDRQEQKRGRYDYDRQRTEERKVQLL